MFTAPVGTLPNKDTIIAALEWNEKRKNVFDQLDSYYNGDHGILNRKKKEGLKNNKVVINHAKYITDVNVGYLLGNPVEYQATDKQDLSLVLEQFKKQTIADEDHEMAKSTSKLGVAYELTYALENNDVHSKFVDPRNAIIVYDDTMEHNILFGITYKGKKSEKDEYVDVKVYTDAQIQSWDNDLGKIHQVDAHSFGMVPLIEFRNNPEQTGDYQNVLSLIDAYNTIQSDRVNDREQLVEAIMVIYGMKMTKEQREELRDSRMLAIPASQADGAKVEFLVKAVNETEIDVLRAKIEADIHKISMTPNLSDENFVGNASGVAIRYKLIGFEQSIANKERYFEKALKQRFKLYNNYLMKLSGMKEIQTYEIDVVFKRNLPSNDLETSQIINNLRGIVDDETLVGQLSFVDDAKAAIKLAQEEAMDRATQLAEQFGTNEPSQGGEDNPQADNNSKA